MNPNESHRQASHRERPPAIGEHPDRAVERDARFSHVMAIALDPRGGNQSGVIRCIMSREGDVQVKGYTDRSKLYKVGTDPSGRFIIGDELPLQGADEMLGALRSEGDDFIGFEDPDLVLDEDTGLLHLYFTIPIKPADPKEHIRIHLGHAVGESLDSLRATMPVLLANGRASAKEVSIAPKNSAGVQLNLVESRDREPEGRYSIVQVAIADSLDGPWEYGKVAFHPKEHGIPWIAGHASPGPLLPRSFIDVGEHKLVGFMNGREADRHEGGAVRYGMFSVGLFIYDYEHGVIEWVSPEPFIQDSEAKTITFASQFVPGEGSGTLYAHVDDSFVRAYSLTPEDIRSRLREASVQG
jgi:hypothetical protein